LPLKVDPPDNALANALSPWIAVLVMLVKSVEL